MKTSGHEAFRISADMKARLQRLSEATERPRSFFIKKAISIFLEKNEKDILALYGKEQLSNKLPDFKGKKPKDKD